MHFVLHTLMVGNHFSLRSTRENTAEYQIYWKVIEEHLVYVLLKSHDWLVGSLKTENNLSILKRIYNPKWVFMIVRRKRKSFFFFFLWHRGKTLVVMDNIKVCIYSGHNGNESPVVSFPVGPLTETGSRTKTQWQRGSCSCFGLQSLNTSFKNHLNTKVWVTHTHTLQKSTMSNRPWVKRR